MAEATRVRSRESVDLKKGEFGYPLGHLGHLTEAQQAALAEFKQLAKNEGHFKGGQNGEPDSHEDVTLLRYLRARRFVPKDGIQQFSDTEKWRELNEIDNLYLNIDVDEYDQTRKLYPQWTGRRDKRGLPVYVFEVAHLNSKTMSAYAKSSTSTTVLNSKHDQHQKGTIPPRLYRLFALYENLTNFIMPLCTNLRDRPVPQTPISQSNNIVDISKVGLKQFWNLRGHMQDASLLATAHYPETLDRIFIVGAPAFFPTVWEWIKRWFDPITVSKIFILTEHSAYKTLSAFMYPEDIPKKYGGELPFVFGGGPILEQYISDRLDWKEGAGWPKGPVKWILREDGKMDLLAVGSENGKERRETLATFTPDPPAYENVGKSSVEKRKQSVDALGASVAPVAGEPTEQDLEKTAEVLGPTPIETKERELEEAGDPSEPPPVIQAKTEPVPLDATANELPDGTKAEDKEVLN